MGKSSRWKYYQPNKKDLKDKQGDCVIRALTKVMGKEWLEVFDELIPYARELQCNPNSQDAFRGYLKDHGFTRYGISNKKGSKRPTVQRFTLDHKDGTYFVELANHVAAVSEGYFWDTWDSGEKCLYGYWVKGDGIEKPTK